MKHSNIVIVGASGAIGSALTAQLSANAANRVFAFVRDHKHDTHGRHNVVTSTIDYSQESEIQRAAEGVNTEGPVDMVLVATGILHENSVQPEKSLKELTREKFEKYFYVNTIIPALIAKHFVPLLRRDERAVFAALSARVGSISDNRLGGWYGYRASKSALNMIIKSASIEIRRSHKHAIVVGLHPGTVASTLSQPFQKNVPKDKLFSAGFAAENLLRVINQLDVSNSGNIYAWDGKEIPA